MREIVRKPIRVIPIEPNDTIALTVKDELTGVREVVLREKIKKTMTLSEVVAFYVEEGDFDGATCGIGGAFLEKGNVDALAEEKLDGK